MYVVLAYGCWLLLCFYQVRKLPALPRTIMHWWLNELCVGMSRLT